MQKTTQNHKRQQQQQQEQQALDVARNLDQIRVRELESENEKMREAGQQQLSLILGKLDLVSGIYSGLERGEGRWPSPDPDSWGREPSGKQMGSEKVERRKRRPNQSQNSGKSGSHKTKQQQRDKERQEGLVHHLQIEKEALQLEILKYKETISLQSRAICELTKQHQQLLKSVGDYREGCASRVEKVASLGKRGAPEGASLPFQRHKGTMTQTWGVGKEVQVFIPDPHVEEQLAVLKTRSQSYQFKFERMIKTLMANTASQIGHNTKISEGFGQTDENNDLLNKDTHINGRNSRLRPNQTNKISINDQKINKGKGRGHRAPNLMFNERIQGQGGVARRIDYEGSRLMDREYSPPVRKVDLFDPGFSFNSEEMMGTTDDQLMMMAPEEEEEEEDQASLLGMRRKSPPKKSIARHKGGGQNIGEIDSKDQVLSTQT